MLYLYLVDHDVPLVPVEEACIAESADVSDLPEHFLAVVGTYLSLGVINEQVTSMSEALGLERWAAAFPPFSGKFSFEIHEFSFLD